MHSKSAVTLVCFISFIMCVAYKSKAIRDYIVKYIILLWLKPIKWQFLKEKLEFVF